ncbi:hypothetical protein B0H13DRAFT_1893883 [Mycena leptocephala]|nr:hypothetical protein B0H13DRAFT_1893883 [Mycena leptocephala]
MSILANSMLALVATVTTEHAKIESKNVTSIFLVTLIIGIGIHEGLQWSAGASDSSRSWWSSGYLGSSLSLGQKTAPEAALAILGRPQRCLAVSDLRECPQMPEVVLLDLYLPPLDVASSTLHAMLHLQNHDEAT